MLKQRDDNYWDFKDTKTSGIHKIAKYPAVMVAPMQSEILTSLVNDNKAYQTMLDPFHGSGVTLVEGSAIGLNVFGIDINPYAHLIAKVKLNGVNQNEALQKNAELEKKIHKKEEIKDHSFTNIKKWFRDDIIRDLSRIRHAIMAEEDSRLRCFYWLCFGETVRVHSNTRTSTFKLHIKENKKIEHMANTVFSDFTVRINTYYSFLDRKIDSTLYCDDSLNKMKSFENSSFDIICTSPPYGDNSTTVTYGQFSSLQLHWIDMEDIGCSQAWLDNFSKIDSASMGGAYGKRCLCGQYSSLNKFIEKIAIEKQQKVYRFAADYEAAFSEMVRILRPQGSMVLTLANRRVDNTEFPFVDITKELAKRHGLRLIHTINRRIQNKRMPLKVSRVNNYGAVSSMSKETVLIFVK